MKVTRNLHDALVALRSEPQTASFPIWADAVCINQKDIKERNNEVKKMIEVYRRASRVVIWLGYVPATWDFLGLKPTGDVNKTVPRLLVKRSDDSEIIHPGEYTSDDILTFVAILDRPYWTRIWILQELVMADYDNTFFFWARTLRHISDLQHAQQIFEKVINTWLRSPEASSLFNDVSANENNGIAVGHRTSNDGKEPRKIDSGDEEAQIVRTILLSRLDSRLERVNMEPNASERVLQGLRSGKGFDADAYLQGKLQGKASLSSVEIGTMLQSLKEQVQLIESTAKDSHWMQKRVEAELGFNELSLTMATMIWAATLDTTTEDIDFRLLMTHSLKGKCTKDSDLVYGLLGLHKQEIVSQITPDYNISIKRVFSDFSATVLRCKGLNFLCDYEMELSGLSADCHLGLSISREVPIQEVEDGQEDGKVSVPAVQEQMISDSQPITINYTVEGCSTKLMQKHRSRGTAMKTQ